MIGKEYIEMTEQEQIQYDAYTEEQKRLLKLYEEQEKRLAIQRAVVLLSENGYKVEKVN